MGFSFRLLYEWLIEKKLLDNTITEDDFIKHGINGYNSSLLVSMYDYIRKIESKIKELETNPLPNINKNKLDMLQEAIKNNDIKVPIVEGSTLLGLGFR